MPEILQPHREQERMIHDTRNHGVDDLDIQPGSPVVALPLQVLGVLLRKLVGREAVPQRHAAVKLEVQVHDARVVRVLVPGRRRVGADAARGVGACHAPRLAELEHVLHDARVHLAAGRCGVVHGAGAGRVPAGERGGVDLRDWGWLPADEGAAGARGGRDAALKVLQHHDAADAVAELVGVAQHAVRLDTLRQMARNGHVQTSLCDFSVFFFFSKSCKGVRLQVSYLQIQPCSRRITSAV